MAEETAEETVGVGELALAMDARRDMYKFLSDALLHEYTAEQIDELKRMPVPEDGNEEVRLGFRRIRNYLSHPGPDPRTTLACEYARIYLSAGVYDGLTAEPYESVFTSEEHIVMQDSRDSAVKTYRRERVNVSESLHLPEDHLGLELEFLSIMAGKTGDELRRVVPDFAEVARLADVQARFLDEHILNWIDDLTEKVIEYATLPLYPAIMQIIHGYATEDSDFMKELAAAARG